MCALTKNVYLSLAIIFGIFASVYLFLGYDFLIWYDAGAYVLELQKYIGARYYSDVQNFNQETATFALLSGFSMLVNETNLITVYKFFTILIALIQILVIYSVFKRYTTNKANIVLWLIILTLSIISINHLYLFIFRQYITSVFLLTLLLILEIKNINEYKKYLLLGYLLAVIIFFHKWTAMLTLPIMLGFFIEERKRQGKNIITWLLIIVTTILVLYLPYLITFKELLLHTIKGFVSISVNNVDNVYSSGQWVSLITGANSPYKEGLFKKIFFDNPLTGMIVILWVSSINKIRKNEGNTYLLTALLILIFLYGIWTNFSQRSTYLILLIACWMIFKSIHSNNLLLKIILMIAVLMINTPIILRKSPFIWSKNDPSVLTFIKNVEKENSVIIARTGNNVIPGQLWFLTWEYLSDFNHNIQKAEWGEQIFRNLTKNVLSRWHSENIKFPQALKWKSIYILIGKNNDGFSFDSENKIDSKKWDESALAQKVIETNSGIQLNHVYLYKTNNDSFLGINDLE